MLKIFLIRHGETAHEGRYKGHLDVPMSQEGMDRMRKTAGSLKKFLDGKRPDAVYSSDLIRAVQSADIIARSFRMKSVIKMPELRERDFGHWEGMRYHEIEKKYQKDFLLWMKDPFKNNPTEGESTARLNRRVLSAMKEIIGLHKDGDNIVIVTHSGVTRLMLCHFLGMPVRNLFRIGQDFGCISLISLYGETPVVRFTNWRPI